MSEQTRPQLSGVTRAWLSGTVLNPHVEPYIVYLTERGYASRTISGYLGGVAHFVHRPARRLRALEEIDEALTERFIDKHLPVCRCSPRCVRAKTSVRAALKHLLALLRSEDLIAEKAPLIPAAVTAELKAFDDYLVEVRGLRPATRQDRLKQVGNWLLAHFPDGAIQMATLVPGDIEQYMRQYTAGWKPASIKHVCVSLRSYLGFKATHGFDTASLSAALPRVAHWRLSQLPHDLSTQEVKQLLSAFDRSTATGRRDYAIARLYIDLGLRTAEITRLQIDDLDWREGQLQIHSKGRRTDVLPLPSATGRAVVAYLRPGRRESSSRALFLRHRPPLDKPATADTIRGAIRNAATRCGLGNRLTGTHMLRHTLACRLVQSGASLKTIADLLRHRSLDTTTIYAKVDFDALSTVAAPWPGRRA